MLKIRIYYKVDDSTIFTLGIFIFISSIHKSNCTKIIDIGSIFLTLSNKLQQTEFNVSVLKEINISLNCIFSFVSVQTDKTIYNQGIRVAAYFIQTLNIYLHICYVFVKNNGLFCLPFSSRQTFYCVALYHEKLSMFILTSNF